MAENLVDILADLKEKEALVLVRERLESGEDPMNILADSRKALEIVGNRFADGTYFIPDLVYSGEILKAISDLVRPRLSRDVEIERLGTGGGFGVHEP